MTFGEKLQQLRKRKGLTQEQLASALFVSRAAVSKWESDRGYPNIDSIRALAEFFSVSVDELLSNGAGKAESSRFCAAHSLFALLDCLVLLFLFLPLFGQGTGEALSLLSLTNVQPYLRILYLVFVSVSVAWGILSLCLSTVCAKTKCEVSVLWTLFGLFLFVISRQPYASLVLLVFLLIKAFPLLKKR